MSSEAPVIKNVIHSGQKYIPIAEGSKAHFHFQTWKKIGTERILVDDSKKIGKKEPMVLVIGHKFKLEVWETIVKMMAVGEVASFLVKKELVYSYPFVSKTLRDLGKETHTIKHSCTMTLHTEGIGYPDLDELISNPCDLEFIIELLKVESSNEYEKEVWQLNIQERLDLIPTLKEKGNKLYGEKKYNEAEDAYSQAIAMLEQLMVRERKTDDEWVNLNKIKIPILLNYAQCKLIKGDFYPVIEHCSTVLQYDPDNEKALFRRAKAHIGAWNPDQAEEDFKHLKTLNPAMKASVDKELDNIRKLKAEKAEKDRDALIKLFMKGV
ncbi:aryl-hydrocarbon-interacting protein-like 1 [Plodia interpunctella]|uniref:aryl-hydrocarbon-interacting protein-like 1 n=1 Tax=Plodia interpunctella TaxID=58824 RepID=UPI002367544B|nr:aryl-hydrocarbon-interacting protein-like 1 [Plodia interpunctella]